LSGGGSLSSEAGLFALLHLSAVVGALTLAYIRLDKMSGGDDPFEKGLDDIKPIAQTIVLETGLQGLAVNRNDIWRISMIFPACVICIIADQPRSIGRIMRCLHFAYRQIHIPFLIYFRHKWHIWVGIVMASISVGMFFFFAAVLVWNIEWMNDPQILKLCYFILFGFTAWLILTNLFTIYLQPARLEKKCHRLVAQIHKRRKKREAKLLAMLDDFTVP
jgi:hypothetical protein